jgi:hypothetical protein
MTELDGQGFMAVDAWFGPGSTLTIDGGRRVKVTSVKRGWDNTPTYYCESEFEEENCGDG